MVADNAEQIAHPAAASGAVPGPRALGAQAAPGRPGLDIISDVELPVQVDVGRGRLTIREVVELHRGSILPLNKLSGETVDIRIGGELLATGEVIVIQDKLRIRVVDIVFSPDAEPDEASDA